MKSGSLAFIKIIIGVLMVVAVAVGGYQLYKYNFLSIKTESAVMGDLEETVNVPGIFFRNEEPIDNAGYQFLDVVRNEGERVAANGVVARVYSDAQSAKSRKEIRNLKAKIATYEDVLKNSGSYQGSNNGIEDEIYSLSSDIALQVHSGSANDAFLGADSLVISVMKRKIASGDLVSYDTFLESLRSELKRLENSSRDSVRTITTSKSGYFSMVSDGLESYFDSSLLDSLTVDGFDEAFAKAQEKSSNSESIGKIVHGNSWSLAMRVPAESVAQLDVNDTVYIRIPTFDSERIKCSVKDLRKSGDECIVVLNSSIILDNILTLRVEDISLIIKTHSGIVVRQSALRKVDNSDGVYVKVGLLLKYKKVDIIYNDGKSAVIKYDVTDARGLRIYDQVVYKGSNLYDGKAVS